jgi:hypothetical protein
MMRIERVVEVEDPFGHMLEIVLGRRAVDLCHSRPYDMVAAGNQRLLLAGPACQGSPKNAARFSQLQRDFG